MYSRGRCQTPTEEREFNLVSVFTTTEVVLLTTLQHRIILEKNYRKAKTFPVAERRWLRPSTATPEISNYQTGRYSWPCHGNLIRPSRDNLLVRISKPITISTTDNLIGLLPLPESNVYRRSWSAGMHSTCPNHLNDPTLNSGLLTKFSNNGPAILHGHQRSNADIPRLPSVHNDTSHDQSDYCDAEQNFHQSMGIAPVPQMLKIDKSQLDTRWTRRKNSSDIRSPDKMQQKSSPSPNFSFEKPKLDFE